MLVSFIYLRLLYQMSSHNSAIASRTDFESVYRVHSHHVSLYIKYRAVWLYPFAHSSNANLQCLHMIIHSRSEVGSVFQSLFILPFTSRDSPVAVKPHFPAHWLRCYFAYGVFCAIFWCAYHTCLYDFYSTVNLFGFKYQHDMALPKPNSD